MHAFRSRFLHLAALAFAFLLKSSLVLAQAPAGAPKQDMFGLMGPLLLTFGVIYFLMIRPQQKREKDHRSQLKAIEKGDEVVTKGGLIGKVTNVADKVLTVEVAEKTRVRVDRDFIFSIVKESAKKDQAQARLVSQFPNDRR